MNIKKRIRQMKKKEKTELTIFIIFMALMSIGGILRVWMEISDPFFEPNWWDDFIKELNDVSNNTTYNNWSGW